jgi:hypothetical protein
VGLADVPDPPVHICCRIWLYEIKTPATPACIPAGPNPTLRAAWRPCSAGPGPPACITDNVDLPLADIINL